MAVGGVYFLANLFGTFLAVGWLFDPTWQSALLLVPPALACLAIGAGAGAAIGLIWRWSPSRRAVRVALASFALLIAALGYGFRAGRNLVPPPERPPVSAERPLPILWVVVDTLRADTFYGGELDFPHAPNLGRYAGDTLLFTQAETTAGWTIPSVAAYFTGIHNTTMDASAGFLPDWAPTVAERLHAAGYATHAVVDNTVIEPRNGYAAGFESYYQRSGYRFAFSLPTFRMLPKWVREGMRFALPTSYYGAPGVTDEALAVLEREREAPLFLYVHYMDPHGPYYPHGEDPPGAEPISFWRVRDRLHKDTSNPPTDGQMLLLRHRYAGEIRYFDAHLTRLLAAWHERFGEQGLVIFTSDHGEEFLEHGHLAHSITVHRELTHVPLMIRFPPDTLPADRARGTIEHPVSLIDLLPTLLDVVGVDKTLTYNGPPIQGTSWIEWLRGEADAPSKPLIASHSRHLRRTYRYREGDWVYVKTMFYDHSPTWRELFYLPTDPFEQNNVLDAQPERFEAMSARFEALAKSLWKSFDPAEPGSAVATEESLRALGYIQ